MTRRGLRVDHHDAVVADHDAGVRIALGGEGVDVAADLGERDRLGGHVAARGEFLSHALEISCPIAPKMDRPRPTSPT